MADIRSKKIYTAALVGTGRIGFTLGFDKKREQPASHTKALNENPRISLIAGIDSNPDNLSGWQKANSKARSFNNLKAMSAALKETPDIIAVAVNEDAHLPIALEAMALKPGLLILEKPVALNLKEAAKIKAASKKFAVPILVNHERRFAYDYNAAKNYIKRIGRLQKIEARLFSGMRLYDPAAESSGAYSLIHDGTHLVDITSFLLDDEPLKKPVITGIYRDDENKSIIREMSAHYSCRSCPDITIFMSGRSRFFGFELDILGTEGRINLGNGFADFYRREESKLYSGFYSLERDRSIRLPKKTGYFANMVQNAVDFLDGKAELKSTLQTGISALKILEEIKSGLKGL